MNAIEVQYIDNTHSVPSQQQIQRWVDLALSENQREAELVVRIVDSEESARLNAQYRNKPVPTNILSFPFDPPASMDMNYLGDLVICASILETEAKQQGKEIAQHWAHIVIHGVLHLQGYDHIDDNDALIMEAKEIAILKKLHIKNPYLGVNAS